VKTFDKMPEQKRQLHVDNADRFLDAL